MEESVSNSLLVMLCCRISTSLMHNLVMSHLICGLLRRSLPSPFLTNDQEYARIIQKKWLGSSLHENICCPDKRANKLQRTKEGIAQLESIGIVDKNVATMLLRLLVLIFKIKD